MEEKETKENPFSSLVLPLLLLLISHILASSWADKEEEPFFLNFLNFLSFFLSCARRGWLMYTRDYRREILNMIGVVIIAVFLGLFFLDMNNTLAESAAKLGKFSDRFSFYICTSFVEMFDRSVVFHYCSCWFQCTWYNSVTLYGPTRIL